MDQNKSLKNVKLFFLLGVGILILITFYLSFKTDSIDDQVEDVVPEESELDKDVHEVDINEVEKKYRQPVDDVEKPEEKVEANENNEDVNDYDLLNVYKKKFGDDALASVEDVSDKVVDLFIEGEVDFSSWKEFVSKDGYEKVQKEISVGDDVIREIKDMNLSYVKANSDKHIKVEIDLSWYLLVDNKPVDVSGNLIYLTFDMSKSNPKVIDIVFV